MRQFRHRLICVRRAAIGIDTVGIVLKLFNMETETSGFKNAASAAVSACGGLSAGPGATAPGETGPEKQEPSGGHDPHRSRSVPARVPPTRARVTGAGPLFLGPHPRAAHEREGDWSETVCQRFL
jgi:hypothetical protein